MVPHVGLLWLCTGLVNNLISVIKKFDGFKYGLEHFRIIYFYIIDEKENDRFVLNITLTNLLVR